MPRTIQELVAEVRRIHFPQPVTTDREIQAVEASLGVRFPDDIVYFWRHCNGSRLFDRRDSPYRILPVQSVGKADEIVAGETLDVCPEWFAFCDVRDGNFVAFDMPTLTGNDVDIIDCFHETFPDRSYSKVVARSFTEFLERALASEGLLFWL